MDEDHPYNNETIYGATKIAGEQFLPQFSITRARTSPSLSRAALFQCLRSPPAHPGSVAAQIVPQGLVRPDVELQQPITIFGDGSQTMDMTYVEDVARANVLAVKSSATADFFNVGTGIATSVLEVFGYMKQLFDYDLPPIIETRDVNPPEAPMFHRKRRSVCLSSRRTSRSRKASRTTSVGGKKLPRVNPW